MKKVTITGGGLAGLSLGITLRREGIPVTVVEAGSYPRHRVCGEFISGTEKATLSRLGISDLFDGSVQNRTVGWHSSGVEFYQTTLRDPAIGISRYLLDERLCDRFQTLGGMLHKSSRAIPSPIEGQVWAAGKKPGRGHWIGLKLHLKGIPRSQDLEMHLGSNGYVGIAGVEDGWSNICALFRMDRSIRGEGPGLFAAYLSAGGHSQLATMVADGEFRENSFKAIAGFRLGAQPDIPGVLRLGDAERLIPPFTGNGMSMAFQSAEIAIEPLKKWAAGSLSWTVATNHIREASAKKFRRRMFAAKLLHPVLLSPSGGRLLQCLGETKLLPFHSLLQFLR